jgi:hypothetical protein
MGSVAVGTVILNRLMFPEKRATLLSVALIAGFVDGGLLKHTAALATMRVVTIGTADNTLTDGVAGKLHHVSFLGLVTAQANLALAMFALNPVLSCVNIVATVTGDVCGKVLTDRPGFLMASAVTA